MIQFEAYLRARGIKPETNATNQANASKGKRRKRSTEKRISDTLPEEKVCPLINPHCKIMMQFGHEILLVSCNTFLAREVFE